MSAADILGRSIGDIVQSTQLNFSANVEGNDGETEVREVPFDGKHVSLLYGATEAARNQVGVTMRYEGTGKQVFPGDRETDFINLAGVNQDFLLVYDVSEGEDIKVIYENRDSTGHYLNIVSTLVQFSEGGE